MSSSYLNDLTRIQQQAKALSTKLSEDQDEEEDSNATSDKVLLGLMKNVCEVIHRATGDGSASGEMPAILRKANSLLDEMVEMAYDGHELYDFVPSYAHFEGSAPLVKDPAKWNNGIGMNTGIMKMFASLLGIGNTSNILGQFTPEAFNSTPKPHPRTSAIARYRLEHPVPTVPATALIAQAVLHGCCSLTSTSINSPIRLHTVPNADIIVLAAAGGWKNREPVIEFLRLNTHLGYDEMPDDNHIDTGLLGIASDLALDPSRKLIYAADNKRIKSFAYRDDNEYLPTHTLKSTRSGPLAIVDHGARILRAGKGGVDVWNVDTLPTHGPKGTKRIGKGKISTEDTWRVVEDDDVEFSTGSPRDASIGFADQSLEVQDWHLPLHWSNGGTLKALCPVKQTRSTVLQIDLEHGGEIVSRYLGHAGQVYSINSSEGDQNTFLTSCGDGVVRLFDVREPLPRLSFDSGGQGEPTYAALYVHVDGIPIVFSGGTGSEAIKVWDVRTRSLAYELATGNNSVTSLAWDAPRSTLYAATECEYMDRMGYHHDYRQAKIGHGEKGVQDGRGQTAATVDRNEGGDDDSDGVEDEDGDEDEDEDEDEYDEEKCWPKNACHDEHYFGYAFDCGDHCLLRYKFGVDAESDVIPAFGMARCDDDTYW